MSFSDTLSDSCLPWARTAPSLCGRTDRSEAAVCGWWCGLSEQPTLRHSSFLRKELQTTDPESSPRLRASPKPQGFGFPRLPSVEPPNRASFSNNLQELEIATGLVRHQS